jgi:uncharacterized protein YrrD
MLRLSELIGRNVITQDAGARIGEVADVLIDGERVAGIVLAGGVFASERVLPASAIQMFGEDTVMASTATAVLDPKQWSKSGVTAQRLSALRRKQILTTAGQMLGVVGDVYVEPTGSVAGYDVENRSLGGFIKHHNLLPAAGVTAGANALVVSEEAAAAFLAKREG